MIKKNKFLYYTFLFIPYVSATVSAMHLEKFLRMGNPMYLSVPVALVYEAANIIIILLVMGSLAKNKSWAYITFSLLIFMQIIGNIYFSYEYYVGIGGQDKFREIYEIMFGEVEPNSAKLILSCLIGVPIPIVSLLLTKIVSELQREDEPKPAEQTIQTVKEEIIEKKEEINNMKDNKIIHDNLSS